jgi:multidrug transporter EmrE-like cation transporter
MIGERRKEKVMRPGVLAIALGSISLSAIAQVMLRKTMQTVGTLPAGLGDLPSFSLRLMLNGWFVAGMSAYLLSVGAWLAVLSKLEVSAAYPLVSIGFILTAVFGFAFLGEQVTPTRMLGIAVVCAGIVLITRTA